MSQSLTEGHMTMAVPRLMTDSQSIS